ncbi:MAG: ferric reductase-like transmembrane domain-containing protein [Thermoanaerobaculia bacterium]
MTRWIGRWLAVALVLLPGFLALGALEAWPARTGAWLDLAGRLTGAVGLACLLVAAAVSVRIPGWDRPFGGLTRLWKLHHRLGLASFLLLLAHPVLMALGRVPLSPAAAAGVLLPGVVAGSPGSAWALWAGWIALLALMAFLAPSFQLFGKPEYQRWKTLHFLSGATVVAGVLHALPLTRTLPREAALALWGGLGSLAVAVFLWRALVARRVLRRPWRIVENRPLADRVTRLFLEPEDGRPLAHRPGQFVYLTPRDPGLGAGRGEEHPYTVSSAPGAERLEITVKALGDASSALLDVAEGSRAQVEGPYGDFPSPTLREHRQLWIGGGVGITPFVSAVRARAAAPMGDTVLLNCANDPSRAYFLDVLMEASADLEDLIVVPHYYVREGPLARDFLLAHCPDAAERHWFVCGPPVLVELARRLARELRVPRGRFHSEDFVFL